MFHRRKGATLAPMVSVLGVYGSVELPSIVCASPVARSSTVCEAILAGMSPDPCV